MATHANTESSTPPALSNGQGGDPSRRIIGFTVAALSLVLAIAVVSAFFVARQQYGLADTQDDLRRTRELIDHLQEVLTLIVDAETGERGYIITGNEDFLEPYRTASSQLDRKLAILRDSAQDADTLALLERLEQQAHEQLAYFGRVIELRDRQGADAAAELIGMERGKRQTDAIRALVRELRELENSRLVSRRALLDRRSGQSVWIVQIAISVAVLLSLTSGYLLLRHVRLRLRTEREAGLASVLLHSTMNSVTQGIAVFDRQQRLLLWNDRYVQLRGLEASRLRVHIPFDEILRTGAKLKIAREGQPEELLPNPMRNMLEHLPLDAEAVREDGIILQMRGRPMSDNNYIVTYTDVTALKSSELAYRDQAARLTSILDNVVDAIITINESGSIESWSKGAERLFGYRADEVLRRNVNVLMPEPHSSAHDGYLRHYLQTGEKRIIGRRREVQAKRKDGSLLPVDLGISEMWIGRRRLFIGIVRDISARLEVERLKNEFVSTVSHELRTPLTSISGSLGLLAGGVAGDMSPKATRLVDIAKQNCERLVRLINDILDLEKAEAGKLDFNFTAQQLKPIVQHVMDENRAFARNYGVTLELDDASDDARVLVDRDRLFQVLTNLISNAAKFSPHGGTVRVSIARRDDEVRIGVTDTGPGIAPEFQHRIFQKFAQADGSDARAKGGTGLGLSIARTLTERLGGRLHFESAAGQGTTFFVSLPLHGDEAAALRSGGMERAGPAILVCEDDPDVAAALAEVLRSEGMHVEIFPTAQAARTRLQICKFDLALIDINLPDMDGLEFISELSASATTGSLPIVTMTAQPRGYPSGKLVGALHIADWLQKPINPQRLLETIRKVLVRLRGRRACILHIEDDESLTQLVRELLSEEADVLPAHTLAAAKRSVQQQRCDLVILDISLGDGSGLDILPLLKEHDPRPPVILYSATEASREICSMVEAALVKSRDPMDRLLDYVRSLIAANRGQRNAIDGSLNESRNEA